jgi:hypothetical protein
MSFANTPATGLSPRSSGSRPSIALVLAFPALFLLAGCMSIRGGNHEIVLIETEPAGAEAVTAEGERCITPCELRLPKMKVQVVWLEKDGFLPLGVELAGKRWRTGIAASLAGNWVLGTALSVAGLGWGNSEWGPTLFFGGLAIALGGGVTIDTYSGVLLKLTPNPLRVVLVPTPPTVERSEDDLSADAAKSR